MSVMEQSAASPPASPSVTISPGAAEFASGWPLVLGAWFGIALGVAAIPAMALGAFMRGMQNDLGWTRGQISLGLTLLVGTTALMSPLVGWVADRLRVAWISAAGLAALAAALFLFSRLGPDLSIFYLGCVGLALVASGAGTVPYARALSDAFVQSRGLAFGVAMSGIGVSFMIAPVLLAPYAARVGWRQGFVTLAGIVAAASPIVGLLMSRQTKPRAIERDLAAMPGGGLRDAVCDPAFITLAVCFLLLPLAVGGVQLHLLSFLGDAGVDAKTAGLVAGSAGLVQIASRLLSGWLVDRVPASRVAGAVVGLAALCMGAVACLGVSVAVLIPLAFGLAMGAEIDLIGYMSARYFGLRAYGRVYGLLYATATVGASLSPFLYGAVFDAAKTYAPALYCATAMLLLSAVLFFTMRKPPPSSGS